MYNFKVNRPFPFVIVICSSSLFPSKRRGRERQRLNSWLLSFSLSPSISLLYKSRDQSSIMTRGALSLIISWKEVPRLRISVYFSPHIAILLSIWPSEVLLVTLRMLLSGTYRSIISITHIYIYTFSTSEKIKKPTLI